MRTQTIDGVTKPVSRLILGTMVVSTERREYSFQLLDDAHELGYMTLDTAHVYAGGNSERCIGEWMQERGNREDVVIIGKGSHPNADRKRVTPFDIAADLHDTLTRLRTDYVDLYMLHRDDTDVPVGRIVDALNEHVDAGRIRAFGGSNWTHERLREANEYARAHGLTPFAASSPNYSLADQINDPWGGESGSVTVSGPNNADARRWYADTQMPVCAWSSLARGFFSGRISRANRDKAADILDGAALRAYCHDVNFARLDRVEILAIEKGLSVVQIALAYVLSSPMNIFAIVGAENRAELQSNTDAHDVTLTEAERAWLNLETDERG